MKLLKYGFKALLKIYSNLRNLKLKKLGAFTLIANNCIAGFLYQKFNMRYFSPTIGLQFPQDDFIKFCSKIKYYLNGELIESGDDKQDVFTSLGGGKIDFPVGKIHDITIFFQHYKTFAEAKEKWEKRKKRINEKKMFFIFIVYDNTPIEIINEFELLPFSNKLIITNDERTESPISFALHNGSNPWFAKMNDKLFSRTYYEQYNFNKWIIKNCEKKEKQHITNG